MTVQTEDQMKAIDSSIEICKESIKRHRFQSTLFLLLMVLIPMFGASYFFIITRPFTRDGVITALDAKLNSNGEYVLYLLLVVIFSVFTSLYRFHSKEIAKYEHFLLGFMRIRIAGNNSEKGYETEVRASLTKDAFSYEVKSSLLNREKKVENPVPGHPALDISTTIINKILDSIEIVQKKKS